MAHEVIFDDLQIGEIAIDLDDKEPQDVIKWGLEKFGDRCGIVTSFQVDGMVILDMAYKIDPDLKVITVDTGRLPAATYEFMDVVRAKYPGIRLEVYFPDYQEVELMVRRNGVNFFYQNVDARLICCHFRKVRPMLRALESVDAWVTGLRRDQWASRAAIRKVELDHDHDGIVKLNPLADWTKEDVWRYTAENGVPSSPLYQQGYTSIGCDPCTRPIKAGEDDRAGRWWWETGAPKECGIHCPIETGGFEHEMHAILGDLQREGAAAGKH